MLTDNLSRLTLIAIAAACLAACGSRADNEKAPAIPKTMNQGVALVLPPDWIEWLYKDGFASLFLTECRKDLPALGECEKLLYSERAKQVWAAEQYRDANSVLEKSSNGWKVRRFPDSQVVYREMQYTVDPWLVEKPWACLARLDQLAEADRSIVEAAVKRQNSYHYNEKTRTFDPAIPEAEGS